MKRILILAALFACTLASAREAGKISFSTEIGKNIGLSVPAAEAFAFQITGFYNFTGRFAAGIGTGGIIYEKGLVPVVGCVRYRLSRPRKFTPFVRCDGGYGFWLGKDGNGGVLVNPSLGISWKMNKRAALFVAVGYGMQKRERLRSFDAASFRSQFIEKLNHSQITIKIGVEL